MQVITSEIIIRWTFSFGQMAAINKSTLLDVFLNIFLFPTQECSMTELIKKVQGVTSR